MKARRIVVNVPLICSHQSRLWKVTKRGASRANLAYKGDSSRELCAARITTVKRLFASSIGALATCPWPVMIHWPDRMAAPTLLALPFSTRTNVARERISRSADTICAWIVGGAQCARRLHYVCCQSDSCYAVIVRDINIADTRVWIVQTKFFVLLDLFFIDVRNKSLRREKSWNILFILLQYDKNTFDIKIYCIINHMNDNLSRPVCSTLLERNPSRRPHRTRVIIGRIIVHRR